MERNMERNMKWNWLWMRRKEDDDVVDKEEVQM